MTYIITTTSGANVYKTMRPNRAQALEHMGALGDLYKRIGENHILERIENGWRLLTMTTTHTMEAV